MPKIGQLARDDGESSLEQHPFVEALVPDPSQDPPRVTVLRGFLGKSTTEGMVRLYLTLALDEYVEIAAADILRSQQLPDDRGNVLWVPTGLQLQHIRTQSQQVSADMLSAAARHTCPGNVGPGFPADLLA